MGERLSGVKDIQTNGAVRYMMRRYYEVMRSWFWSGMKTHAATTGICGVSTASGSLLWAAALTVGVYLFRADAITIGTVYLVYHYFSMLSDPITRIMREVETAEVSRAE